MSRNIRRTRCLLFSFNCEATVRELETNLRGRENYRRGTHSSVVDCEVVLDDSLLLPFELEEHNCRCLIHRHRHSTQGSAGEAVIHRIVRVTIDLRVKRIGSHFERINARKERIRFLIESHIEAFEGIIVFLNIHHELHLFHLHGHDAGLKIYDVWEIIEEVLDFEDLVRGVRDFGFESIGSGRDISQLCILC